MRRWEQTRSDVFQAHFHEQPRRKRRWFEPAFAPDHTAPACYVTSYQLRAFLQSRKENLTLRAFNSTPTHLWWQAFEYRHEAPALPVQVDQPVPPPQDDQPPIPRRAPASDYVSQVLYADLDVDASRKREQAHKRRASPWQPLWVATFDKAIKVDADNDAARRQFSVVAGEKVLITDPRSWFVRVFFADFPDGPLGLVSIEHLSVSAKSHHEGNLTTFRTRARKPGSGNQED